MTTQPIAAGAASRVDADLVARAYRKVMNKEELTNEERRALKRHETEKEEQLRWKYYQTIPQKHWRDMSGRQTKVLNEQALRYGIPFGGATISLPHVVKALHDFLADNAQKLARDDDPLMQGSGSPALERYREERATMVRLDRLAREGELLPRDEVREALGRIASIIRSAGDMLERHHGAGALDILTEALDDAQRELDRCFGPEEDEPDVHDPVPDPG
jgi:hypothetical protein